jgi:hypothetical protein
MLHRIFDELDGATILLSVRAVCQPLRAATDNYDRYVLDFTSTSKPDFHRLLPRIHPDCVTGLSLSDSEMTKGQIGLFLSLVDIGRFIRLRSLTLLNIDTEELCSFLQHARGCSVTSLILRSGLSECLKEDEEEEILQHLSSIIAQPSLLCFVLFTDDVSDLIEKPELTVQCKLRHLRTTPSRGKTVSKMITASSGLEILTIERGGLPSSSHRHQPEE